MEITATQLKTLCPHLSSEQAALYAGEITSAAAHCGINTPNKVAQWLANMIHESGGFRHWRENLYYTSEKRIRQVFPRKFGKLGIFTAWTYVRDPERLANYVYAGMLGNGPALSGDGWAFRGAGPLQLTGRETAQEFFEWLWPDQEARDYDLKAEFERVGAPDLGFLASAWFCAKYKPSFLSLAEQGYTRQCRQLINPPALGLAEVQNYVVRIKDLL